MEYIEILFDDIAQTMKKLYPAKSNEKIDEGGEDE